MLSILIFAGIDASETGMAIALLEAVAGVPGSHHPYLVPIIAIFLTVGEAVVIVISIRRIYEHGYAGAVVSGMGFFGTLSVFGGAVEDVQALTYAGIAMWAVGCIAVRLDGRSGN